MTKFTGKDKSGFFFPPFLLQVVELISSAIGDLVQGIYYENSRSSEVRISVILHTQDIW